MYTFPLSCAIGCDYDAPGLGLDLTFSPSVLPTFLPTACGKACSWKAMYYFGEERGVSCASWHLTHVTDQDIKVSSSFLLLSQTVLHMRCRNMYLKALLYLNCF